MTSFLTYWHQTVLPQIVPPLPGAKIYVWQGTDCVFNAGCFGGVCLGHDFEAAALWADRVVCVDFIHDRVRAEFFLPKHTGATASTAIHRQQISLLRRFVGAAALRDAKQGLNLAA